MGKPNSLRKFFATAALVLAAFLITTSALWNVGSAAAIDRQPLLGGIKQISTGLSHSCALTNTGALKCWGRNSEGQLGDGTKTIRLAPVDVSGLTGGVTQIATGG